jgi:hypothetical protein
MNEYWDMSGSYEDTIDEKNEQLDLAISNFEAMDLAMRTPGVPIRVAMDAFESGMAALRRAKEVAK